MARTTRRTLLTLLALLLAVSSTVRGDYSPPNPYEAKRDEYRTRLLIVGGSSSGTAAAITAGRLEIPTVWVLRAPRDMGGLSANAVNPDSDLPMRYLGGLALEYDVVARYTTGFHIGGRRNGEGYFAPFHVFFNYTRQQIDGLPSVTVLANLYPVEVAKNPKTHHVDAVTFADRCDPGRRVRILTQFTIDAEIEGDVCHLAGVSMTLRREARGPSQDPTRDNESYAGRMFTPERKIGSVLVAGGAAMEGSTHQADDKPATMAWNGSVTLKDYGEGTPKSPWVLAKEPDGYDSADFDWWTTGVYGVPLDPTQRRWNIDQYLSTVEGWRLPDGRHVLESMDIRDREANERAHLAHVICGLWHLEHVKKQYRYGLSDQDFREGLPPKYSLSDFGTATNEGDAPLPGLIYMREGRRMVNDHVFGGKLIEDDGSGRYIQKRYWHPRSAYFNAMLVDIHGVHLERRPGSGPEGAQLLRLAGFHNFGAPCIPFDVFVPRPREATGLLVSSAGAYTHQAYAAFPRMETGRILQGHACAVAAHHAMTDGVPVHEVDVRKVQLTGLALHGQSLVYLDDAMSGTSWHLVDQMLAARRVPERNDQGVFQSETGLSVAEAADYFKFLFRDYTEQPVPTERLQAALELIQAATGLHVSRGQLIRALTVAVGLETPATAPQPFADVPTDSQLARTLAPWIERRWIVSNARHRFEPDQAMPFSEFKRHAFHACFGSLLKTPLSVDYRPWLVHDPFNRPDEAATQLATGQKPIDSATWKVETGQLRPTETQGTTYFLVETGAADVDASVDIFLEQTKNQAAAGLVVRATDSRNMERFLLQANGPAVHARIDAIVGGQRTTEVSWVIPTLKRGFTLRVAAVSDEFVYFIDGKEVKRLKRQHSPTGTGVGVVNGGGEANRFDNLEARVPAIRHAGG
ncbi:MAG TPA: FAD-dependent oxidoreductase [Thermoguttaceae bacterium]|nr:FAD-dependent oxidoreductase [Thermoguttaceae bacterium]